MELTTQHMRELMPLCGHLDIDLVRASSEEVVGSMEWSEATTTMGGAMHGGALMSLADTIGGVVAFLNVPEGAGTSTISSSTVFLRGLREGTLTATGRLIHKGRTTIVAETELTDAHGRPVARTTQTQSVLMPRTG